MVLAPFTPITLGLILPIPPKCEISLNLSKSPCKIPESVVYYSGQQYFCCESRPYQPGR